MTHYQTLYCDVFAPSIGTGNPLAVIFDADGLDDAQMQAIANWTNLAETTFLLQPTKPEADYRVRIFTTQKEIAFAGHPSIGSAHAWLTRGIASKNDGLIIQECQAGLLPIRHQPTFVNNELSVRVPSSKLVRFADSKEQIVINALPETYWSSQKPALVEGGRRWWLAQLADESSVRNFNPDAFAIKQLASETDSLGLCIFALCDKPEQGLVVRAFPLGVGIAEDPASGAANAAIAAFLNETEQLTQLGRLYTVSQGREISRNAVLTLEIDIDQNVWVGGTCQSVLQGTFSW
jgi:PhzF family phenazine biosynthesis protein